MKMHDASEAMSYLPFLCVQLTLLSNFASNYHAAVDGRGTSPEGIEMNELYGGARIRRANKRTGVLSNMVRHRSS